MNAVHSGPGGAAARIGPNAVIQLAAALSPRVGATRALQLFEAAGAAAWWRQPPEHMVPQAEVARLHRVVRAALDPGVAREVARDAGTRTAEYLLRHRIPAPVQFALRLVPASWAAAALLRAIGRNAWTFAGSGRFEACRGGDPVRWAHGGVPRWTLTITGNPLCRGLQADAPACDYYAATFERLFRRLVHPGATVTEVDCEARGDAACRFAVRWR